ncbi:MAG: ATP-dependent Clp protease proteolytic subunit [Nitrospinae bacterium]|nr:ATP-dependent Clp protease proteolytic subunit [Nitrospinota bacterium]
MPNWNDVLSEIGKYKQEFIQNANQSVDIVRRKYLKLLFEETDRNIIAYYSGFLSKPGIEQSQISDEDKNAFMMAIHKLDRSKGLDLIIHSEGGSIAATESIVDYLHRMFGSDIRAIVPQIAMSAGTMLACSCKEIIMAKHSNIGPIDPWLRGVPAQGVKGEFKRAFEEIKADPAKLAVWQPILMKYQPTFLSQCENAIDWAHTFVKNQLTEIMFSGKDDAVLLATNVVTALSNYDENKSHGRHIHFDEAFAIGLNVKLIENDCSDKYQDLLLTVHHCFMHSLTNTPSYKMIENHNGVAFVKQLVTGQS